MDEVFDSSLDGFGTEEFLKIIKFIIMMQTSLYFAQRSLHDKFESVPKFDKVKGLIEQSKYSVSKLDIYMMDYNHIHLAIEDISRKKHLISISMTMLIILRFTLISLIYSLTSRICLSRILKVE